MNTITVHQMGGMGNQLFQIFATLAYALRHKCVFKFEYREVLITSLPRSTYWMNLLKSLQTFTTRYVLNFPIYKEPEFTYTPIPVPEKMPQQFKLYGYFQSEKYFKDKYSIILKLIKWDTTQETIKTKYAKYLSNHPVSMHFRIADYAKLTHVYHIQKYEYYQQALETLLKTQEISHILYFCQEEDNKIVEPIVQELKTHFNIPFILVDQTIPDWEQMVIMSLCKHNIIANSTYSWWGAYLNMSKEKQVICPSLWFSNELSSADLCPEEWIQL